MGSKDICIIILVHSADKFHRIVLLHLFNLAGHNLSIQIVELKGYITNSEFLMQSRKITGIVCGAPDSGKGLYIIRLSPKFLRMLLFWGIFN